MKKPLLACAMLAIAAMVHCADITVTDASASFSETTQAGAFECVFQKCMANDLYTFYQVKLNGKLVNSAQYSDNIGPFLVTGAGWIGGNHLSDSGNKSGQTTDVAIFVDGEQVSAGSFQGSGMEVRVTNELYMPDGSVFAIENVKYLVSGNSIEVWISHEYKIAQDAKVERYYGMQSMFDNETEILAPGAKKYNKWIAVQAGGSENAINIKGYEAPKFSVFIEKSAKGYQAAYLEREDLGRRTKVAAEDVVYIGNSYGKSYHKTIGNAIIKPGETTKWHGIYSWFDQPVSDSFITQSASPVFEYSAYVNGRPVILKVNDKGEVAQTEQDGLTDPEFTGCPDACPQYYSISGMPMQQPIAGQVCLRCQNGETTKIIIK